MNKNNNNNNNNNNDDNNNINNNNNNNNINNNNNSNNNNIHLCNVEYNKDTYSNNYNISNKCRQNPRRYVYCFACKITLRPFMFNSGAISSRLDYRAAVKIEITYTGEVP